jgi:N-methylhydantoinase B
VVTDQQPQATADQPEGWPWTGRDRSYRPRPGWRATVPATVRLHTEVAADLDPVTYEVVRHRLWTINLINGETLTRLAGSPVFQALDFSMSILTQDGEVVLNSPYAQVLNAGSAFTVRYILEHLAAGPGIDDGDVFLTNDPWIGAIHQMDVTLAAPVFNDGLLFAWVSNSGHQVDLGGISAHGTPVDANDVFAEPFVTPPFKIVEHGTTRSDLEALYLRQSRAPDVLALDLRAQVSGCVTARDQLTELCQEYGPATVHACLNRMIDSAERRVRSKLGRVPDGTWSELHYYDSQRVLSCARCGEQLADYQGDYRMALRYDEAELTAVPGVEDPNRFLEEHFVLRRYCCPSCAVLMATEIRRSDEPHRPEMIMAEPTVTTSEGSA